jgi:tRNA(fMet)-specific endonuclease VapC
VNLYILDTDTLTLFRTGNHKIRQRVAACLPGDLAVAVISVEEQLTGWYNQIRSSKSSSEIARAYERLADTVRFFSGLHILNFDEPAIARFELLRSLKLNVGGMDLRIGAIALEHNAIVVSRNVRDFGRIPNLAVEDWSV